MNNVPRRLWLPILMVAVGIAPLVSVFPLGVGLLWLACEDVLLIIRKTRRRQVASGISASL